MSETRERDLTAILVTRIIILGPEPSPERLRGLIQRRNVKTAQADEIALLEHLSTDILDAWGRCNYYKKMRHLPALRLFFVSGNCAVVARELGVPERTVQALVRDFCRFVPQELKRQADHQRAIDAARAQCQESCGRRYRIHDISGPAEPQNPILPPEAAKRLATTQKRFPAETRQCASRPTQGGRCPDCPLTALGV